MSTERGANLARGAGTVLIAALLGLIGGCGGTAASHSPTMGSATSAATSATAAPVTRPVPAKPHPRPRPPAPERAPFAVGERVVTLIDRSRTIQLPSGAREPRTLVTLVRYPAVGPASAVDVANAVPARAASPFPLVVFGHGFAVTPGIYAQMLRAWVRAGYVVAAPIFPLENQNAPGGPNESDLVNQPRDMSLVISRLLTASAYPTSIFTHLIDPGRIAVSGQSDGGETALAVAYDRYFIDRRVRAAMILSGAKIPGVGGFDFPAPSPPLLATQGTADTINPPSFTHAFFDNAPAPKFLLTLFGAQHLGPYTEQQPQLQIVERVTIAFLDHYVKGDPGALRRMEAAGGQPGAAALQADP